ncbi:MAG: hypothetical protein J0L74_11910 [Burkholderiales bacterium]|nr:hypothetical protein [Burkholderiales bacterium]
MTSLLLTLLTAGPDDAICTVPNPNVGTWRTATAVVAKSTPNAQELAQREARAKLLARLWLPGPAAAEGTPQRVFVPRTALVQRAEMTGLYVLGEQGQPLLRQVRLGRVQGEQVEVLAGLSAGEKVVTEPQAAVRRAPAGR